MEKIPDQFLFINKTANSGSLSHSKSKEKANIYSHVHSKYHKDKKGRTNQLSPKNTNALLERHAGLPNGRVIRDAPKALQTLVQPVTKASYPNDKRRNDATYRLAPRICASLNESAFDPFFCSSVSISAKEQDLLYYPFRNFLETTFKAESLSVSTSAAGFRHKQAVNERLQQCAVDDLTMYTTLAYSASCMRWTVGEDDPERPAEIFILKAIDALRVRLKTAEVLDIWLIFSIYALAVSELWAQNYDAASAHLRMLNHFLAGIGGLNYLNPYMMESIILCDKYVALGKFEPPILPLDWEPAPLPKLKVMKVQSQMTPPLRNLAQGFQGLVGESLGIELCRIVQDIVICVQLAEHIKVEATNQTEDQRWLFLRHQACVSRLMSLQTNSRLQDCTRVAIVIWTLKITAYFGAQRWSKKLLYRLKSQIIGLDGSGEWIPSTLLFWMTCLGAMTAEYTEERDWFLARTLKLAKSLVVPIEKQAFRSILQRYLFIALEDGLQFFRMVRALRELETEMEGDSSCMDMSSADLSY